MGTRVRYSTKKYGAFVVVCLIVCVHSSALAFEVLDDRNVYGQKSMAKEENVIQAMEAVSLLHDNRFSRTESVGSEPRRRVIATNTNVDDKAVAAKKADNIKTSSPLKPMSQVPDWSLASLTKLSDAGLISPSDVRKMVSAPDRDLMARMISRANQMLSERNGALPNQYDLEMELHRLMLEYDAELRNLGYKAGDYSTFAKVPFNRKLKISGEVRYHYVDNGGDEPFKFFDSRLRTRIYLAYPLDDKWSLHSMIESEKSWFNDRYDGRISWERIYITGSYKDWNFVGGRYAEFFADGNVYDGEFTGVSVNTGNKLKVKGAIGQLRDNEDGGAIVASYQEPKYAAEAGIYSFNDVKAYAERNQIFSLSGTRFLGNFTLGAMYLRSNNSDHSGDKDAYILSLRYGRVRAWVPGTNELFLKYYDQADSTYMGHTMVGLADSMHGFRGIGAGFYYTVAENLLYGVEYYDLEEKSTGKNGRTFWNQISYFF